MNRFAGSDVPEYVSPMPRADADPVARRENISLNALRAAAAILVVVSHTRNLFFRDYSAVAHSHMNQALYAIGSLGHAAVMIFFALSGFWVGGSVLRGVARGNFDWRRYAVNRITRLWLVLIPALLLTLLLDEVGMHAFGHSSIYRGAPGYKSLPLDLRSHLTVTVAVANLAFLQTIHSTTFGNNGPLWSLAYEFWFYLLCPCLVIACWPRANAVTRRAALLIAAVAIGVFIGGVVSEYFLLWVLGAVVAWTSPTVVAWLNAHTRAELLLRLCALVLVAALMVIDKARQSYTTDLLLGGGAAGLVAVLAADRPWGLLERPISRFSLYAHSSYSLYAIHFPIVALLAAAIVPRIDNRWTPTAEHLLVAVAIVCVPMAAAWLMAQMTERRTDVVREWLLNAARLRRRSVIFAPVE